MTSSDPLSTPRFAALLILIVVVAALLRGLFPTADPPWNPTVGIVWHDEGAWVHNARNKALFGDWVLDRWNPLYIAPVFTTLEYLSFEAFGVGLRQARLVSELTGLGSVVLLALGLRKLAGPGTGLVGGALLATNYVYVMYNRAAIMEASMVAFMVAAWYCYVRAQTDARWGWIAGACALLAFFTKAAAAFFVAAIGLDALLAVVLAEGDSHPTTRSPSGGWLSPSATRRAGLATLGGLIAGGGVALATFVLPNWTEYRFYNWQMSVTRKPGYSVMDFRDRITWFPILHDVLTRMWAVVVLGTVAVLGFLARWRSTAPPERLLVLWIALGTLELLVHDAGNERRFLIFIPALVALASLVLLRDRTALAPDAAAVRRTRALLVLPVVLFAAYVVAGALTRLAFIYEIRPNVRLGAALAVAATIALYATWPKVPRWLSQGRWSPAAGVAVALLIACGDLLQFGQWARGRTYKNYEASVMLGRVLPPGTLVHGKLANGLALENGIRPVFVGRGFGNYDDRKVRDDVRYILTYVAPSLGYESQARNPVILDVLETYPNRATIMTFDVAETSTGHDRAALIDKFGRGSADERNRAGRAQD
jgi:4-amino-4-deoxy-L-arabinose transferase-like glycosyltransferase